jgi:hypothetical protein
VAERVPPSIECPVCFATDQIAIEPLSRTGTCTCGVVLLLDGRVVPAGITPGYPACLFRRPASAPSPLDRTQDSEEIRYRLRGSWIAKTLVFTPSHFEQRTRLGKRLAERIANLRGFVPIQELDWSGGKPTLSMWSMYVIYETSIARLYPFKAYEPAAAAARELTNTLRALVPTGDPFRS